MRPYRIFNLLFLLPLLAVGCKDDDKGTVPSPIKDVRSEERPGGIALFWTLPADKSVHYVKVSYHDHLLGIDEVRLSSCDSILIPDTRARFGDYRFTIQPFSRTDNGGKTQTVTARSGRAPVTEQATRIILKAEHLGTNAQEPSEGPIANLIDGNIATFFHTAWSVAIPGPHWLQIRLPEALTEGHWKFWYAPRNNGRQKPTDFDILVSAGGSDWTLVKKFTKDEDGLPVTATDAYTSPNLPVTQPFDHIRMVVNAVNSGEVFFTMSEFRLWQVKVVDPEAE